MILMTFIKWHSERPQKTRCGNCNEQELHLIAALRERPACPCVHGPVKGEVHNRAHGCRDRGPRCRGTDTTCRTRISESRCWNGHKHRLVLADCLIIHQCIGSLWTKYTQMVCIKPMVLLAKIPEFPSSIYVHSCSFLLEFCIRL